MPPGPEQAPPLSDEQLAGRGLYDPAAPDADDQLELVRFLLELGATPDQIEASGHRGELAIDLVLRPRSARTLAQVVDDAEVPWATVTRLMTAIGLSPDPDNHLTSTEEAAVRLLAGVSAGFLGEDATVQLARVAGNAMARVADTIVSAFRLRLELPQRAAGRGYTDVIKESSLIAQTLLPGFMSTLDAIIRRQIVAVAERVWSPDEERVAVTLPRTVGFADLVDYTIVSGSLSAGQLADVLMAFDERTAQIVTSGGGQVVKTIGDEVLFVTEDAVQACAIAVALVGAFGRDGLPPVRVGLARGTVVSVLGDVYGPDVNLAARLVGAAEPATVVTSEAVAEAAAGAFTFEALTPVTLKGFPGVTPLRRVLGPRTTSVPGS